MTTPLENLITLPARQIVEPIPTPELPTLFSRRDRTLNAAALGFSTLTFELDANYFRIGITDAETQRLRLLEEFGLAGASGDEPSLHEVRHLMSSYDLVTKNFWHSVKGLINNQSFTLVPASLFQKEYAIRYLELARGTSLAQERVHFTRHPEWQVVSVFSLPARLDDWLSSTYPFENFRLSHQIDAILTLGRSMIPENGRLFLLYLEKTSVTMLSIENGQLIYANRFAFRAVSDLIYYVVFVLNELKINALEINALILGRVDASDEIYKELVNYFPNLLLGQCNIGVLLEGAFADLPPQRYAAMLSAATL